MRKITLIVAFIFSALQMNAQIAPGSVAPDFTVTDINGNVHSLSAYLAAGKTVIMDVSATWCGPCWNYHNNHALEDLYTAYGPGGSDEVVVLFIEGDASTTIADLNGTGSNTQGNWVAGTPYPIIDGTNIGSLYQITYFPTVFRICPDGLVSEVGAVPAAALRTSINTNCGTLTGVQNHVKALDTENGICTINGSPIAKFKNYGENIITGATLNLKENGTVVGTKSFVGTTPRFATRTVTFDALDLTPTSDYTVEIVNANSGPIFDSALATADMGVYLAEQTASDVTIKVYTDNYPTEITWRIKNGTGLIVASGGPYTGSQGNATITTTATFATNDCFSVELSDSYGDGWNFGSTQHGIEILVDNAPVYSLITGSTSFTTLLKSNVLTTQVLALNQVEAPKYGIYPNPSTGIVRINTLNPVQVDVIDALGKVVYHSSNITSETTMDLSGLQKGIYIARIVGENTTTTEKIILR